MLLTKFRIQNFRSIEDSGWVPLSEDGVTAIVGMNESGKTSLLEALACTLGDTNIESTDLRFGRPTSEIHLEFALSAADLSTIVAKWPTSQKQVATRYFSEQKNRFHSRFYWVLEDGAFNGYMDRNLESLYERLEQSKDSATRIGEAVALVADAINKEDRKSTEKTESLKDLVRDFSAELQASLSELEPTVVLFSDDTGLLPDSIDISAEWRLKGAGAIGARNFLTVAGIDLKKLVEGSDIERVNLLKRATKQITQDFGGFWSQNIGSGQSLQLECEIQSKRETSGAEAGKPYLSFWITDGVNRLHPSQRSKGLRWFLSFYLQLRASETQKRKRIFLLDEPGANLHETAQADVLKLINKISQNLVGVLYTTHSPHLIEPKRFHRIITVERATDNDESPTIIKNVLRDASSCASETLSPIYTKMGVDFWRQTVIDRSGNVLLEEPSSYFYIKAFWKLTLSKKTASFIACTGVNNIPQMAYMFTGWGLGFSVVVDDESSGRSVFNELKKELFGNDDQQARNRLLKIPDCAGIEDVFSTHDFQNVVLANPIENYPASNSKYMKSSGLSKPTLACKFFLAVENGTIKLDMFDGQTQERIKSLVAAIEATLP